LLGKNHRGIPLECQRKSKRLSNPPFSDHAGRVNCPPILKSHTVAKRGDAMTKEEPRRYWKTRVDEQRQIGLPASISRHYSKIKPPGHRLAICALPGSSLQSQPASCLHNPASGGMVKFNLTHKINFLILPTQKGKSLSTNYHLRSVF